jgi:hypothetical protein
MSFVSTGKHKIIAENCCIVFEPSSGKIVHVYRIRTIEGAEVRSQEAIMERALELSKKHGATADILDVIHVDPTVLGERGRFKVHTKSRTLVALKSQAKRATQKKAKKRK